MSNYSICPVLSMLILRNYVKLMTKMAAMQTCDGQIVAMETCDCKYGCNIWNNKH